MLCGCRQEEEEPMLGLLEAAMAGRRWLCERSSVDHFERLLEEFGGAREKQRWRETYRLRVEVIDADGGDLDRLGAAAAVHGAGPLPLDEGGAAGQTMAEAGVPLLQRDAVLVARAARGLLLTANVKACRDVATAGVHVEAALLRPVWLTGT